MSAHLSFVKRKQYQQDRLQVFGSDESLRWFIRGNRALLVERGALLMPNGRELIDPDAFDGVVREVGARRAARSN